MMEKVLLKIMEIMKSGLRYRRHIDREMYVLIWPPTLLHLSVADTNGPMDTCPQQISPSPA